MILPRASEMLVVSPGSLIYLITTVLSTTVLLIFAYLAYSQERDAQTTRSSLAALGLFASRILLTSFSVLASLQLLNGALILPSFERYVSLIGIGTFFWAFIAPEPKKSVDGILLAFLSLSTVGLISSILYIWLNGIPAAFNHTLVDAYWSAAGLLAATLAVVFLINQRPRAWIWGAFGFSLLSIGATLHITMGIKDAAFAGFVRWAELAAYPLLALSSIQALRAGSLRKEAISRIDTMPHHSSPALADVVKTSGLISAKNANELATRAVELFAQSMRVEVCLLLSSPMPREHFSIATAYDLIREVYLPGTALDADKCPVIATAMTHKRSLVIPASSNTTDLNYLKEKLNFKSPGSAMLVPLIAGGTLLGGLLLLSPYVQRRWHPKERGAVEEMAAHLAQRFWQMQREAQIETPDEPSEQGMLATAHQKISELEQEKNDLAQQLLSASDTQKRARDDRIAALLEMHERDMENIGVLEKEIEALQSASHAPVESKHTEGGEQLAVELQIALEELSETRNQLALLQASGGISEVGEHTLTAEFKQVTSIASELRKPLSSAQGYIDLLMRETVGELGELQRKYLDRMHSSMERMKELLHSIPQPTAVETSPFLAPLEPINFQQCLEQALATVTPSLQSKKLTLKLDIPRHLPPLQGPKEVLLQILIPLLMNAVRVSPEDDEIILTARVQQADDADFLMLTVSDAGVSHMPYDGEKTDDRSGKSILHTVGHDESAHHSTIQSLCESLGGRAWFDYDPNVGNTCTVLFPAASGTDQRRPS
jgi:signal transduction histidine kinase